MNKEITALLKKEIIKLRLPYVAMLVLICFAGIDTYLNLKSMFDSYGSYNLTLTIAFKNPHFFKHFELLLIASAFLSFAQFWPEVKDKRLRLLFNMPIESEKIISSILVSGLLSVCFFWGLSFSFIIILMNSYALPEEVIYAVLHALATWWLLSIAAYLLVAAFVAASSLYLRVAALIIGGVVYHLFPVGEYLYQTHNYIVLTAIIVAMIAMVYFVLLDYKREVSANKTYRITQAIAYVLIAIACLSKPPEILNDSLDKGFSKHNFYYSLTREEYVTKTNYPEAYSKLTGQDVTYSTASGERLTHSDYKAALPLFYYQDLSKWNMLPSHIQGIEVNRNNIASTWTMKRFKPEIWTKPSLNLHIMLESIPKGVKFTLPKDILRIKDNGASIDFYIPEKGYSDTAKNTLFTEALVASGFEFPIVALSNNTDTKRKTYDNGFIIADSKNQLFQFKMVNGEPVSINLNLKTTEDIKAVLINEDRLRQTLAYVVTETALYAISDPLLELKQIPIDGFHFEKSYVEIFQDIWGWGVTVTDITKPSYAMKNISKRFDTEFKEVANYTYSGETEEDLYLTNKANIIAAIFPWTLRKSKNTEDFSRVHLQFSNSKYVAVIGMFISVLLLFCLRKKMKQPLTIFDYLLTAFFGVVALLTVVLLNRRDHINIRY